MAWRVAMCSGVMASDGRYALTDGRGLQEGMHDGGVPLVDGLPQQVPCVRAVDIRQAVEKVDRLHDAKHILVASVIVQVALAIFGQWRRRGRHISVDLCCGAGRQSASYSGQFFIFCRALVLENRETLTFERLCVLGSALGIRKRMGSIPMSFRPRSSLVARRCSLLDDVPYDDEGRSAAEDILRADRLL